MCSMKSLLKTDPLPAACSAISFSRAKACGLRVTVCLVPRYKTNNNKTAVTSAGVAVFDPLECIFAFRSPLPAMPPPQRLKLSGCVTRTFTTTGRPGKNANK